MTTILITWTSTDELVHDFEAHIKEGGLFVRQTLTVPPNTECELVLVHPRTGYRLQSRGKVVFVGPNSAGIQIAQFKPDTLTRFSNFVFDNNFKERTTPPASWMRDPSQRLTEPPKLDVRERTQTALHSEQSRPDITRPGFHRSPSRAGALNVHERVRALGLADRRRLALTGSLAERVALEKAFGKDVWDPLVRNPRVTVAEIAKIARMGTLPIPIVDSIAANNAWIASPQVRRALLSNPRLQGASVIRVLRACPRNELKLIQQQRGYPSGIREAARKLAL